MTAIERAVRFHPAAAAALLDGALAEHGPAAFLRDVAEPLLRRLRDDELATGRATAFVERRLAAHTLAWATIPGPLVTLACAPRERRTVGLLRLGFALAERDCRVAYLGPRTSAAVLAAVAEQTGGAPVVLSAETCDLTRFECARLRAIASPLVIVGAAREEVARVLRVSALGPDADRAAADIARTARTARGPAWDQPLGA